MSIFTKSCFTVVVLLMGMDIVLMIAGLPRMRDGLDAVIWFVAGGIHWRIDHLDLDAKRMRELAESNLRAIERQTDVVRVRR